MASPELTDPQSIKPINKKVKCKKQAKLPPFKVSDDQQRVEMINSQQAAIKKITSLFVKGKRVRNSGNRLQTYG